MEREREESPERGEKRVRTDTDTHVESTQSRQKGQMKSIFSDSDEEAIVKFIKQHEELYEKTNDSFKDKQKKERLWEQLAATRNLLVKTVKKWFDTQRTRYGKLTRMKSGQGAEKSTEQQTWLKDSFSFLRGHIRRKGVSKSSAFKSPQRPSAATASVPDTSKDTESEMEISIASSAFEHQSQSTTASSCDCHHVCRSSLRSFPADEVDDFHISGCTSGPHSKSSTVILQLSPL